MASDSDTEGLQRLRVHGRVRWELELAYKQYDDIEVSRVPHADGDRTLCNMVTIVLTDGSITLRVDEPPPEQKSLTDGEL